MDAIFKALNDPARRALLDSLRQKDGQSLGELEKTLEMTRFGVMKHLRLLEEAGLIVSVKRGRFKYHYLNALPLQEVIDRWIDPLLAKPAARAVIDLKSELEGTAPMPLDDAKPDFVMATYIRCSQDALWDALTDPKKAIHYHFMATRAQGHLTEAGETTYYVGDNPMLQMKMLAADPKSRIEFTFQPHWAPDLDPSRSVYLIAVEGPHCRLTVEHYDIPAGQDGVADGWARMLSGLKTYLESGQAAHFSHGDAAQ